jgi:hypothetical protein
MRKLLIGGIALLTTMLLNAEDTLVSSYNGQIDKEMNATSTRPSDGYAKDKNQTIGQKNDEQVSEQMKWDNLTDEQKQTLANQRTDKRNEGVDLINKDLTDLDNQTQKLSDDKSNLTQGKFDYQQKLINQKKASLSDMKMKLEQSPVGENVDLKTPLAVENQSITSSTSRHM